ncbi:trypsin-like peptidase domain-containing protein [Oxynema sp. CENA135]|uniref:COP23 domain-containing protein n=1 Tax=Oxynema sp. CENA135 TaxID=984206 RepID=UPI0019095FF6|nr:trypsin-like peptidase domain-containing protein [Oxynema sp. CENA135]MBK4728881.1 trypsin-like peptidase domain-containing protein [Oxynema sp. CENA135]
MLFRFSQIKFLSHFLLGMVTVSAWVASPFAAVRVLANENECDEARSINTSGIPESAHQLTVRVEVRRYFPGPDNRCAIASGSGTLIARENGNQKIYKYTILTVAHNFGINTYIFEDKQLKDKKVELITHDEKRYEVTAENVTRFNSDERYGLDLAVATFESDVEYPVATLAPLPEGVSYEIREQQEQLVRVTGWPNDEVKKGQPVLWHNLGIINPHEDYDYLGTAEETRRGYVMGYNAETAKGVSGGPVFDEQGRLIGVHGQGSADEQNAGGPSSENIIGQTVSGGIPINTFTDQLPGSDRRPKDRNTLFDNLEKIGLTIGSSSMSIQASLPPSDSGNDNIAENSSQSIDTYLEQAAQHWKKAMTALNASAGAGCIPECREEAEKALAQYDQALEIIGNNPSRVRARVLVFRGIVHQLLGNSSKKESDWEAASKIIQGGGEPLAYVWLGNTLYRWGNTQKAEELWDEAVNIANSDDNADVYLEIGQFLIQNGRREEGREYWNRLITSLPENSVIRRKIADKYTYFAMVGYDDFAYDAAALEQANKAVELAPNNPYALYDLAKVQANLGNTAAAEATLQQAASNCEESICGTLIEDLNEEKQLNVNIAWGGNTFGRDEQSSGSSNSNNQASTVSSEGSAPEQEFTPDPNREIATGPTYFCNDASRQTMRRSQPLIEWQSREFGRQYQPDDRCTYVSNRLESYETDGLLNQAQIDKVTYGVINGYRVLCIATDENAATARNCDSGQLIVTLGSVDRISIGEADAALKEFKDALLNPNYVGPLDNIKGVSKPE